MPGRDTKTRFQGVYARHQERCATTATASPSACTCSPSYYASVWDRTAGKYRKTKRFRRVVEARNARADLIEALRQGKLVDRSGLRLDDACERFVTAAREGVALNKWGRRYRRRAVEDLESALRQIPDWMARRKLADVRRGDVQRLIDQMSAANLSGSRVRSVVNAIRSLYRWAQDRELADHDPAANVRLPVMGAKARNRVATPAEFARLLEAVRTPEEADTLPWGLAGYATARHQEIRTLDWVHVDLELARSSSRPTRRDESQGDPGGSFRWFHHFARCCGERGSHRVDPSRARSARRGGPVPARACSPSPTFRSTCTHGGANWACSRLGSMKHATPRRPGLTTLA
jgi:hypothetical protein